MVILIGIRNKIIKGKLVGIICWDWMLRRLIIVGKKRNMGKRRWGKVIRVVCIVRLDRNL
jgi:hypothetical protein